MSDIEAIKVLKELSSVSLSWYDKANSEEQKKIIENDIEALDLAIQALQEKAEREALQSKCISCKDRKASVTVSDLFCNSCGRKLPKEGY